MRSRWLVLTCLTLLLVAPVAAAEGEDVRLTLREDAAPTYEGPDHLVHLVNHTPGEHAAWRLNLTSAYTVAEVHAAGAFDVERPRQVVPLLDGKHFVKVSFDVTEVDEPAKVFNVDGNATAFTYRLGIPGPTNATLHLEVDRMAPGFDLGAATNVTHRSFQVETRTTEAALAELRIRPAGSSEAWVPHPTPSPGLLQRFPVIGLEPDTLYEYAFTFTDWSGNQAESGLQYVHTEPEPDVPVPVLTVLAPLQNATVAPGDARVRVHIESPDVPVLAGGVRFFFDKLEDHGNFTVDNGTLAYVPPAPLAPGLHTFSVEVENALGGEAYVAGRFHVTAPAEAPAPGVLAAVSLLAVVGVLLGRSRRVG